MNRDPSRIFHERYFSHSDRRIEMHLKNGQILTGYIIGFCYNFNGCAEPPITKWHLLESKNHDDHSFGGPGLVQGVIIRHEAIRVVIFLEDMSSMGFEL